ncbi:hypothetical protein [Vulcanisaeta souniana]|uniref:hypothetical protein n=1 Tax=Vulcanisaeta souniana TaxID=164452 RepID=UPI000B2E7C4B|nr:hypothetical protein [Vulcanisaeta souniana]
MDGVTEVGSTAQVAKLLGAPVVLVINGERINRTVRAIIRGLRIFDPSVRIVGAVITNVNQRQLDKLRTAWRTRAWSSWVTYRSAMMWRKSCNIGTWV